MPKYTAALRIDSPTLDPSAAAAAGGYVDQLESPAPPALAEVESPYGLLLSTLLSRSANTPTALVNATWSPPDGYDTGTISTTLSYLIQWSTDSTFATNVSGAAALQPSAAIDGLATGTLYYFRVAAVYSTVQSLYSTSNSITTAADTVPPDPVTSVAWFWGASGDLDITWVDPTSPNLKRVEVKIWSDAAKTTFYRALYAAAGALRTTYTAGMNAVDTNNVYDAAVFIEAKAQSWGGIDSTLAVPASQPTKAVPATPTGLTSSWASDTGVAGADCVISWTRGADAIKYRLTIDGIARETVDDRFTYTFDTNRAEHSNVGDHVLTIGLVALDGLRQSSTSAPLTATNAAPTAPTVTLTGAFSQLVCQVTSAPVADFLTYEYVWKRDGGTVRTLESSSSEQQYESGASGDEGSHSWTCTVRQRDLFGRYSTGTASSAVILDTLTIAYLRSGAFYTDDAGGTYAPPASGTLASLKDGTTASGGISYSA
jgi:hypothetical protein